MLLAENITRKYGKGHTELTVLDNLCLHYNAGEVVGIYGSSGSGKSTLLHIIGGLDRPSGGRVSYNGEDLYGMSSEDISNYRNRVVGFVFQFYHLLQEFSALENAMMPALIGRIEKSEAKEMAMSALSRVGLSQRINHKPSELSGGEQQRVAIARAIIMKPEVLLADEPTGNLDHETGRGILDVLKSLNANDGMGIIMVTHDMSLVKEFDRKMELIDGKLS